jgi:hypothetical protein
MWTSAQQVHGWLHPVFAVLLVPTTILALVTGYRRHRNNRVVTFMTIGLLLVLIAAFPALHYPGVVFETILTMSGSVFLISGHFLNWRLSRQCKVDRPGVPTNADWSNPESTMSPAVGLNPHPAGVNVSIESRDVSNATT